MIGEHGRPIVGYVPPSGAAIRRADTAMARREAGLCEVCCAPLNDDGQCGACRVER